ncbi:MAG: hypothetical protein HY719_06220 [Planctomycetes bacterium]|nr:hypothetical protein [Planctomycetota bacterium]
MATLLNRPAARLRGIGPWRDAGGDRARRELESAREQRRLLDSADRALNRVAPAAFAEAAALVADAERVAAQADARLVALEADRQRREAAARARRERWQAGEVSAAEAFNEARAEWENAFFGQVADRRDRAEAAFARLGEALGLPCCPIIWMEDPAHVRARLANSDVRERRLATAAWEALADHHDAVEREALVRAARAPEAWAEPGPGRWRRAARLGGASRDGTARPRRWEPGRFFQPGAIVPRMMEREVARALWPVWAKVTGIQRQMEDLHPHLREKFDWALSFVEVEGLRRLAGKSDESPAISALRELAGLVWWWDERDGVITACDPPTACHFDDQSRLSREDGPALAFAGETRRWMLFGVRVPRAIVATPGEQLNPRLVLTTRNAEVRRVVVRKVGLPRLMAALRPEVVDRRGDYELLVIRLDEQHACPYLKMKNPSTGETHIEGVHPNCRTVQGAINWRASGGRRMRWEPEVVT